MDITQIRQRIQRVHDERLSLASAVMKRAELRHELRYEALAEAYACALAASQGLSEEKLADAQLGLLWLGLHNTLREMDED